MRSRKTKIPVVAYFSMEIAATLSVPTYAGGLGLLAVDPLRAAADLEVSMAGVTLHRLGYFPKEIIHSHLWTQ